MTRYKVFDEEIGKAPAKTVFFKKNPLLEQRWIFGLCDLTTFLDFSVQSEQLNLHDRM